MPFKTCNIRLVSKTVVSLYSQSSNMLNQARLRALKVREDHVRNVLEEARRRLGAVTRNPTKYAEILNSLIVQGLLQVICRECYMLATRIVAIVCDMRFFWQVVSWN
jgi:vacuolar-type H+-ATPase subunit E/Vma4